MKIVICASVDLTPRIKEIKESLEKLGHSVSIPYMSERIIAGDLTLEQFLIIKEREGDSSFRQNVSEDFIKRYYNLIKDSDAVLVLNEEKKGIKNYVGGNTFLEIGFAYVQEKKIYLYNPIPEMPYSDEIKAMAPIILNGDLTKINV
jgi:nucleoside 2-deoxyribosyltransferase